MAIENYWKFNRRVDKGLSRHTLFFLKLDFYV